MNNIINFTKNEIRTKDEEYEISYKEHSAYYGGYFTKNIIEFLENIIFQKDHL